jgi:hypothetical protein
MLDYQLWGMRPLGFLVTNVGCHFLSAAVLYFLLTRLGMQYRGALFGAAIFLLHPVQIESVLWISQRKSVLAMLFFLLAFHSYLNYREQSGRTARVWYVASIILCLLAALSKSAVVIFPVMLVLYDHLYLSGSRSIREHLDKIPYLLVSVAVGMVTFMIQTPGIVGGRTAYPVDFAQVLPLTMLPVLASYLKMVFWPDPSGLSIIYSVPWSSAIDSRFAIAAVIAVILVVIAVCLYRRGSKILFWYGLFFLALVPVSQIIPLVTKMNDRYLYFPMLGIAGLCAFAAGSLLVRQRSGVATATAVSCLIGIIAALGLASYKRSLVWRSTVTLFKDASAKTPNQYAPWAGMAAGYRANGDIELALNNYEIASRYGYLDPGDAFAIARIYLERNELEKAHGFIWGGILKSTNTEGVLLLGIYHSMAGNLDAAEEQLLKYLESAGNFAEALATLGKVYLLKGNLKQAEIYSDKAMLADVNFSESYIVAACVAGTKGDVSRAIALVKKATQLGFSDLQSIEEMDCLTAARKDPGYRQLLTIE